MNSIVGNITKDGLIKIAYISSFFLLILLNL